MGMWIGDIDYDKNAEVQEMRDSVIQIMIAHTDKDMLKQAYVKLSLRNHCELIIDMMRRECKYEVLSEFGKTTDDFDDPYDYTKDYPDITLDVVEPVVEDKSWIVCRINRQELDHISKCAKERGFKGVASFVLATLRKKGFIRPKIEAVRSFNK